MTLFSSLVSCFPPCDHLYISITGSGGKTTLMHNLAQFLMKYGKTVLMTTTTKIQNTDYKWDADFVFEKDEEILSFKPDKPCVALFANKGENPNKLYSPKPEILKKIKNNFDFVLSEADGARHLPLKLHTDRDPVVPDFSNYTVVLIGSDCINRKAGEVVFGYNEKKEKTVDANFIQKLLCNPQGPLKGTVAGERIIVVNCDSIEKANLFLTMQWPKDCSILIGSVKEDELFKHV